MKVYMFHYVTTNFNYFHFNKFDFEQAILELMSSYNIIGLAEAKKKIITNENSDNDIILTFDDGTKDHYETVYPILKKYGIKGVFFLSSNIFHKEILDIHLIHRLISKVKVDELFIEINNLLKENKVLVNSEDFINNRFDNYKMKYIKQLLQFILPDGIRNKILMQLISKYKISLNFNEYYLSPEKAVEMKCNGMDIGLHTKSHKRLNLLSKIEQEEEILENLSILNNYNLISEVKALSYPFGNYNKDTIDILKSYNIDMGFTIDDSALKNQSLFEIGRIDCNYLKSRRKDNV